MNGSERLSKIFGNIADAIREKKGTTDLISPEDFSTEIASIENSNNTLTSWEGYDESTMGEYALSAKLGYEFFSEFESINSLLDEVNGVTVEIINEINGEII